MSLILKGIDLPRNTEGISVTFHTADGWMESHILDVTQAIQIPKGHGRLTDGDVIKNRIEFLKSGLDDYEKETVGHILDKALGVIESYSEYAPTILEAEEE